MPEQEIERKSKYNSGIAKEMRRNELWKSVNKYSIEGSYIKWNEYLDKIWLELSSDVKKKFADNFREKKNELLLFDTKIAEIGQIIDKYDSGFNEIPKDVIEKRNKHYKILMEKEEFLRLLEEDVGKGTNWEDDEDDDF